MAYNFFTELLLILYIGIYRVWCCGDVILLSEDSPSFYVTSPNFGPDTLYPVNIHCQWSISSFNSTLISIKFDHFDLEYNEYCSWDYITIFDGDCTTPKYPTKYCGTSPPLTLPTALSGKMCLEFFSDIIIPKTGFNATLLLGIPAPDSTETETIPEAPCDTTPYLINSTSIITSPNYGITPKYPNNRFCQWLIIPEQIVKIEFKSFDLEYHSVCGYDSIKVYDGFSTNFPVMLSLCGNQLPESITLNTSTLLTFTSDMIVPKTGFKAIISFINPSTSLAPKPSTMSTPSSAALSASPSTVAAATTTQQPPLPTIKSPVSPTSTSTTQVLPPFKSSPVSLKASTVQMTSPTSESTKKLPSVVPGFITDSHLYSTKPPTVTMQTSTSTNKAHKLSSSSVPSTHKITTPVTSQSLKTSTEPTPTTNTVMTPGTSSTYKLCKTKSVELTSAVSVVSPNYGYLKKYFLNSNCQITFYAQNYVKIGIFFQDVDVEKHYQCIWDKIIIYDGNTTSDAILDTICGTRKPVITSTGNSITIQFISDHMVRRAGFKAVVEAVAPLTKSSLLSSSSPTSSSLFFSTLLSSVSPTPSILSSLSSSTTLSLVSPTPTMSSSVSSSTTLSSVSPTSPILSSLYSSTTLSSVSPTSPILSSLSSSTTLSSVTHTLPISYSLYSSTTMSFVSPTSPILSSLYSSTTLSSVSPTSPILSSLSSSTTLSSVTHTLPISYSLYSSTTMSFVSPTSPILSSLSSSTTLSLVSPTPTMSSSVSSSTTLSSVLPTSPISSSLYLSTSMLSVSPASAMSSSLSSSTILSSLSPTSTMSSSLTSLTTLASVSPTLSSSTTTPITDQTNLSFPANSQISLYPSSSPLPPNTPSAIITTPKPSSQYVTTPSYTTSSQNDMSSLVSSTTESTSLTPTTGPINSTKPVSQVKNGSICDHQDVHVIDTLTLTSPNFGLNKHYPTKTDCGINIKIDHNSCFTISFPFFDLEDHPKCNWDYLIIYDGDSTSTTRLAKLCGRLDNKVIVSSTNQIFIKFHSDEVISKPGFTAIIQATPLPTKTTSTQLPKITLKNLATKSTSTQLPMTTLKSTTLETTTTTQSISTSLKFTTTSLQTTTSTQPTTTINVATAACSGIPMILTAPSGYVISPGFDSSSQYDSDLECQWIIHSPSSQVIQLEFLSIDIEYQELCEWDSISIYDGPTEASSARLGKYCGDSLPPNITSSESHLFIKFTSDRIVNKKGFKIFYSFQEPENGTSNCILNWLPCNSGLCIPKEWFCDEEQDCPDNEDEDSCAKCKPDEVSCFDGACIPQYQKCDGVTQCSDGEDEDGCTSISTDGRFMVMKSFKWFPVCTESQWSKDVANQACLSMGNTEFVNVGSKVSNEKTYAIHSVTEVIGSMFHRQFELSNNCPGGKIVTLDCQEKVCGQKSDNIAQAFIVGGSQSTIGDWPWVVAIMSGEDHICGGTIISHQWILTAGHCVSGISHSPQTTTIVTGSVNLGQTVGAQRLKVSEVLLHPQHNFIYNADVALVRLQKPMIFTDTIRPICLPRRLHSWSSSLPCYIAGWGSTSLQAATQQVTSENLHHAKIKVWPQSKCNDVYPNKIKDFMICAGYETGHIDACKGDSGGPLMCKLGDNNWIFVGITSWGEGCGDVNKPGVYTRVDHYIDWIKKTTESVGSSANCNFESPNICGYTDQSNSTMMFTRRSGGLNVPARPLTDVTLGSQQGGFIYVYIPYEEMSKTAILVSPFLSLTAESCLTFWFNFHGGTDAILKVYGVMSNGESILQVQFKQIPKGWRLSEVDLTNNVHHVQFVVQSFNKPDGGVAIDDINISNFSCLGVTKLNCNFDAGNLCNYKLVEGDSSDLILKKVNTPPDVARSSTGQQDHYLEINGSAMEPGDTVKLLSPTLNSTVPKCFSFKYKITSQGSYTLSVCTVVTFNGKMYTNCHYWVRSSSVMDDWTVAKAQLPVAPYSFQIGIQAKRNSIAGIVAVDEIRRTDGNCS